MPYFDQLFERLPNGSYRERSTRAPLDSLANRYFRNKKTGKITVVETRLFHPPGSADFKMAVCDAGYDDELIDIDAGYRLNLTGGNWMSGSVIGSTRFPGWLWGSSAGASWNG